MQIRSVFLVVWLMRLGALSWSVQGQWTDNVTDTPSLVQVEFGPYGQYSPTGQTTNYANAGEHGLTLLAAEPVAQTTTINNPYPASFEMASNVNSLAKTYQFPSPGENQVPLGHFAN